MNFKERFSQAAIASVTDIFETMLPLKMDNSVHQKPLPEEMLNSQIPRDIIGTIGIAGDITGTISLFLSCKMAMIMASLLLEEDIQEINEDVYESVAELTNMVAGGIKTALSTQRDLFELSLPTVISGENQQTHYIQPVYNITLPIFTDRGTFFISTVISTISRIYQDGGHGE